MWLGTEKKRTCGKEQRPIHFLKEEAARVPSLFRVEPNQAMLDDYKIF